MFQAIENYKWTIVSRGMYGSLIAMLDDMVISVENVCCNLTGCVEHDLMYNL